VLALRIEVDGGGEVALRHQCVRCGLAVYCNRECQKGERGKARGRARGKAVNENNHINT